MLSPLNNPPTHLEKLKNPENEVGQHYAKTAKPTRVAVILWDERRSDSDAHSHYRPDNKLCQNTGSENSEVCLSGLIEEPLVIPATALPGATNQGT